MAANMITKPPKPLSTATAGKLVCFSFAAYAKTLIHHLKSSNIPVLDGLTDLEFSSIESTFSFSFPPDLRSILREGLPVGHGFPNWRSSSLQQLHILTNLPTLTILKQVSHRNFWCRSWGVRPHDVDQALDVAKRFLDNKAPVLVPIYRNCYVPASPNMAGNPVLCVDNEGVRVLSCDITWFFQEFEFLHVGDSGLSKRLNVNVPAWAAKAPKRVEFWMEASERTMEARVVSERGDTRGWWSGELGGCLEEVFWTLREGGWTEEEVREMMMIDGCDGADEEDGPEVLGVKEGVVWHVRLMSLVLLRAGWTREDVVYSLGLLDEVDEVGLLDGRSCLELQRPIRCFNHGGGGGGGGGGDGDGHRKSGVKQLMHLQSLEV